MRYMEACLHKYKLKANRYFMTMQKILLRDVGNRNVARDPFAKCPLNNVDSLKRIEIYDDELTFVSRDSKIDMCVISSEVHRNFFLIAMEGTVFKYDLVSKELLFQFKTNATKAIMLYDKDDKLVVASEEQIRLWDFYDHKEEAPELITSLDSTLKVEQIYVNKHCRLPPDYGLDPKSNKFPLCLVVVCKDEFIVYKDRLEKKSQGTLPDASVSITSAEFSWDSATLYLGTSNGKIHSYNTSNGQQEGNEFKAASGQQSITMIKRFGGLEDQEVCLITIDNKEVYIYEHKKKYTKMVDYGDAGQTFGDGEICNIHISLNNKFFVVGIPKYQAFGVFAFDPLQMIAKNLKWITKVSVNFKM